MIKPQRLRPGDTVAIVSLSSGMLGEKWAVHKLDIAKQRLEKDYGLKVKVMPNALKGIDWLANNPQARAKDLMQAFRDKTVKGIICAIGGSDTIRLLPYINFETIKNNPKIFMGFSDTTVNHFMMYKAGLVSYYGGSLMNSWAEYIKINDYCKNALDNAFFHPQKQFEMPASKTESFEEDKVWWKEENINTPRKFYKASGKYEVLQGKGKVQGRLLGGCLNSFCLINGTKIWPSADEWKGKIMFIEISEECQSEHEIVYALRNLQAQGILKVVKAIIVGKPAHKQMIEPLKNALKQVVCTEAKLANLPIVYGFNFGHAEPIGIVPYGLRAELDCDNKKFTVLESFTK